MNKFRNKLFTKKNVQVLSKNEQLKINGGDDDNNVGNTMHQNCMNSVRNIRA